MSDFVTQFQRPDAGIRTAEGIVSGNRASQLEKQRQKEQEAFEERKRALQSEDRTPARLGLHFAAPTTGFSGITTSSAVGLVSGEEYKRAQEKQKEEKEEKDPETVAAEEAANEKKRKKDSKKKKKAKRKMMSTLSFATEEDVEEEEMPVESSLKDPSVDTSFLPDSRRDAQEARERDRLRKEWLAKQATQREIKLTITYSYWDGSGHRRTVEVKQGDTVGEFLEKVRQDLSPEFRELASSPSDSLVYVKEDLILPHDLTFYDLIASKARGKSGPLFCFDVTEDIRVGAIDSRVETVESHPGKVVERQWYERNKHIFPASKSLVWLGRTKHLYHFSHTFLQVVGKYLILPRATESIVLVTRKTRGRRSLTCCLSRKLWSSHR